MDELTNQPTQVDVFLKHLWFNAEQGIESWESVAAKINGAAEFMMSARETSAHMGAFQTLVNAHLAAHENAANQIKG